MAIPFIRAFDFTHGAPKRLTPHIERIIADNPGPFTYTGTGVFIIGSGRHVCVIDPGPDTPAHRAALWAALEGRRVSAVLLTHHHLDHTPLARPLADTHNCPVYGLSVKNRPASESDVVLEEGTDTSLSLDHEVADGDIIKGDGWTIMAMHTPGHTSNHVCYALVEENALFTGDHIMGWSTSVVVPPDGSMRAYMESLRKVRDAGFATLYPTHGAEITDVTPFVDAYIAHREAREAQILAAVTDAPTTILDMVADLYANVDVRLHPAAAQSVLSHLLHLEEDGRVSRTGAVWALA